MTEPTTRSDRQASHGPPLPGRLSRYLHTVRYLRPSQLGWYIVRRVLPLRTGLRDIGLGPRRAGVDLGGYLAPVAPPIGAGEIAFLNERRPFDSRQPDWRAAAEPKLWRYNLHYFDYLGWPCWSDEMKCSLIDSWIAGNAVGEGDGWEPFTVSLRVVNWMRFIGTLGDRAVPEPWLDSLRRQVTWLAGNVEYHILANHLVKNAKALALAGTFFDGPAADRLRTQGLHILAAQADEQFLADGGHFERSPMYHALVLEDYLDVLDALARTPGLAAAAVLRPLRDAARRGTRFLAGILAGDGDIPLFNDSAFGIAPAPSRLLAHAARVLGEQPAAPVPGPQRVCFPQTGYYGYRRGGDSLLIDCGPVGPDYQPGHAHADALSYELCVDGRRMIVDGGVHDYESGELRRRLRGTAAHNTVRVDGADQSETWGGFRVARRAYPRDATLGEWEHGVLRFGGAHDGYRRLPGAPLHRRAVTMDPAGRWEVADEVSGGGVHAVESFIHLHPDLELTRAGERTFLARHPGGTAIRIRLDGPGEVQVEAGDYCPEFGVRLANRVLVHRARGPLPLALGHVIERA